MLFLRKAGATGDTSPSVPFDEERDLEDKADTESPDRSLSRQEQEVPSNTGLSATAAPSAPRETPSAD